MTERPAQPIDPYLEREYDVRKLRSDFDDIGKGWAARSAAFRAGVQCSLDVAYGSENRQRLDIFHSGRANAPLHVFIHGGYWQRGDKSVYSFVAEPFVARGCDVCLVNYTLCPTGNIPRITDEIAQALAYLWRNADRLRINRDSIHLSGHSAGGHLTGMMLAKSWKELGKDLPENLLASGLPMSGLYDLDPLRSTTISDALGLDDASTRSHSPMFLAPASAAPVLVILGDGETTEFHKQSNAFCKAWEARGVKLEYYAEPQVDHFDLLNRMADDQSELFRRMLGWIEDASAGSRRK
jgi:arylformamidase